MTMHFTEIIFRIYVSDPYSFDFDPGFLENLNSDLDLRISITVNRISITVNFKSEYRCKNIKFRIKNGNPSL
jgi:hypothetical protein